MTKSRTYREAQLVRLQGEIVREVEALRVELNKTKTEMAKFLAWDLATYSRFLVDARPLSDGMLAGIVFSYPRLFNLTSLYYKCRQFLSVRDARLRPAPGFTGVRSPVAPDGREAQIRTAGN